MPSSSLVSGSPADLLAFSESSFRLQMHLLLGAKRLTVASLLYRSKCEYGRSAVVDGSAVESLLRDSIKLDMFVADVAEQFRKADLGRLLDGWSALAAAALSSASNASASKTLKMVPGARLLRLDTSGDGRLVEVRGDLLTAKHVVILIPGMSNDLSNVDSDLRPNSDAIFNEMKTQLGGDDVAVITWLGYDTPDMSPAGVLQVAGSKQAEVGAKQLLADVTALRSGGLNAHVTVVGHSYGSVVVGIAMKKGLQVDDVVVVGSPGMDAPSRKALGSPNIQVWASATGRPTTKAGRVVDKARNVAFGIASPLIGPVVVVPLVEHATGGDGVTKAVAHEDDPAQPGFGSTVFVSGGSGHSAYFDQGSSGLANIAKIATGKKPNIIR